MRVSYLYFEWSNNRLLLECIGGHIPHPETDTAVSPRGHQDSRLAPSLGTELSRNNHHKMYALCQTNKLFIFNVIYCKFLLLYKIAHTEHLSIFLIVLNSKKIMARF